MGAHQSSREDKSFEQDEVNFDHFQILRAIGKGSFGKVCIVQKKDSKQMFAMKYMNKQQCLERDALKNVLREVEILTRLEHPFLVNLWFSFQDEEDLFMVSDLMLGGDLRYHINQEVKFSENCVKLCVSELALALDYLQTKHIVHRDIKPDNILLDEAGHAHLADFNIATILDDGRMASSLSGTKPYIAPEVFECAADNTNTTASSTGYGFPVDWWSLGVCAYELLRGVRPFDIRAQTPLYEVRVQLRTPPVYLTCWSADIVDMLSKLLCVSPGERISSLEEYSKLPFVRNIDMDIALKKGYRPPFTPAKDHLNCDPTFELEEMIIETKPLHKKKKRLAKQRSIKEVQDSLNVYMDSMSPVEIAGRMIPEFIIYNRSQEMERREREKKEQAWEKELLSAMNESEPEVLPQKIRTCKSCSRLHERQNVETRNSKSANEKLNEQTGNSETNVSDHVPTSSSEHYLHGDSTKYQDDTNVQASSKKHIPDYSQHVQASYMHGNCKKYISDKCEHVPTSSSDQYLHEECKKHISENCQQGQASSSDNCSKKCISDKSKHVLASSCDKKCNSSKSDHALASSCDNCGKKYISDKCEQVMASSSDRHLQADCKKHQFKRRSGDSSCNVLQTSEEIFLKTCDITDHLLSDIDYIDRTPSTGSNA